METYEIYDKYKLLNETFEFMNHVTKMSICNKWVLAIPYKNEYIVIRVKATQVFIFIAALRGKHSGYRFKGTQPVHKAIKWQSPHSNQVFWVKSSLPFYHTLFCYLDLFFSPAYLSPTYSSSPNSSKKSSSATITYPLVFFFASFHHSTMKVWSTYHTSFVVTPNFSIMLDPSSYSIAYHVYPFF